ncbi:MAG: hypothetical protein ABEL04_06645 [Salinibacter sp.]|uniref:hypothetical protein n=1 Tax=Salinibacter sp. TaxID=2065818 RepID=UPI0035D4BC76
MDPPRHCSASTRSPLACLRNVLFERSRWDLLLALVIAKTLGTGLSCDGSASSQPEPAGNGVVTGPDNSETDIAEETDIVEYAGFDPNAVHGTIHTEAYDHAEGTQRGRSTAVPGAMSSFRIYTLQQPPARFDLTSTGSNTFPKPPGAGHRTCPFNHDFHLTPNITVGGAWGGQDGVADNIWPARMLVDYVRVYKPKRRR